MPAEQYRTEEERRAAEGRWQEQKWAIQDALTLPDDLGPGHDEATRERLRRDVRAQVERVVAEREPTLTRIVRERIIDEVLDEVFGLGELEVLLKDPTISDICVFGPALVLAERRGKVDQTGVRFRTVADLERIIAWLERGAKTSGSIRSAPLAG
jgi:pilus assembly protein CpaF